MIELDLEEQKALDTTFMIGNHEQCCLLAIRAAVRWMRLEQEQRERADIFKLAHASAIRSEAYWKKIAQEYAKLVP